MQHKTRCRRVGLVGTVLALIAATIAAVASIVGAQTNCQEANGRTLAAIWREEVQAKSNPMSWSEFQAFENNLSNYTAGKDVCVPVAAATAPASAAALAPATTTTTTPVPPPPSPPTGGMCGVITGIKPDYEYVFCPGFYNVMAFEAMNERGINISIEQKNKLRDPLAWETLYMTTDDDNNVVHVDFIRRNRPPIDQTETIGTPIGPMSDEEKQLYEIPAGEASMLYTMADEDDYNLNQTGRQAANSARQIAESVIDDLEANMLSYGFVPTVEFEYSQQFWGKVEFVFIDSGANLGQGLVVLEEDLLYELQGTELGHFLEMIVQLEQADVFDEFTVLWQNHTGSETFGHWDQVAYKWEELFANAPRGTTRDDARRRLVFWFGETYLNGNNGNDDDDGGTDGGGNAAASAGPAAPGPDLTGCDATNGKRSTCDGNFGDGGLPAGCALQPYMDDCLGHIGLADPACIGDTTVKPTPSQCDPERHDKPIPCTIAVTNRCVPQEPIRGNICGGIPLPSGTANMCNDEAIGTGGVIARL